MSIQVLGTTASNFEVNYQAAKSQMLTAITTFRKTIEEDRGTLRALFTKALKKFIVVDSLDSDLTNEIYPSFMSIRNEEGTVTHVEFSISTYLNKYYKTNLSFYRIKAKDDKGKETKEWFSDFTLDVKEDEVENYIQCLLNIKYLNEIKLNLKMIDQMKDLSVINDFQMYKKLLSEILNAAYYDF